MPRSSTGKKTDDEEDFSDPEEEIETLFKLQSDWLDRAKNALKNVNKDGTARKTTRAYYTTRLESFGKTVSAFEKNHRQLVTLVSTSDRQTFPYFKDDLPMLFEDVQLELITALQSECEEKFKEDGSEPEPKAEHLPSNVTLPPISIPKFSDSPTEWKSFHDVFKSIVHSNDKLPGSHKIQYLNGALSGEAKDLISGFELCDDDYQKAWKVLCDVYNDKPSMFMHIMNRFASLEHTSKEQPEQLRELMKATSSCLKSLESVGIDIKLNDAVIAYFLIRKLPPATVAYWEETRDRKSLPSFEAGKTCMETRIRVAAAIANVQWDSKVSTSSSENRAENNNQHYQSKSQPIKKKRVNAYHSASKPTSNSNSSTSTTATASTKKPPGRKFECPVCHSEGHPLRACERFLAMPSSERKSTITKLQYCVNCLAFNHQESKCRSSHICFTCGERNHSLLHVSTSTESIQRTVAHVLTVHTQK